MPKSRMSKVLCLASLVSPAAFSEEKIKIQPKGDLRYRYETIQAEDKVNRVRHRIRARLGAKVHLQEGLHAGFRLVSGGDDAVSSNQTLDGGFSSKGIRLDQAYIKWAAYEGVHLTAGKMKLPFYRVSKSQLIWDGDLSPEGIFAQYDANLGGLKAFLNAGSFWIDEKSSDKDDVMMNSAQVGVTFDAKAFSLTAGVSGYVYSHVEGSDLLNADDSFGNSVSDGNVYANDYQIENAFFLAKFKPANLALFYDYAKNSKASKDNKAFMAGFSVGKGKAGSSPFKFAYKYKEVEKDAVVGAFSDSDFIGGGTDGKGHIAQVGYAASSSVGYKLTYFANKKSLSDEKSYDRAMADVSVKF